MLSEGLARDMPCLLLSDNMAINLPCYCLLSDKIVLLSENRKSGVSMGYNFVTKWGRNNLKTATWREWPKVHSVAMMKSWYNPLGSIHKLHHREKQDIWVIT